MDEYNSIRRTEEQKKIEKIVTGSVKKKKKNEILKFADIFIAEDISNVKSYIFMDVVVPAIKNAISDIVEMMLWGGEGRKKKSSSKVSYRSYYDKINDRDHGSTRVKSSYNYEEIILDNRGEAEEVLAQMDELISKYKIASVADLYDLVGATGDYTDNKYGWTDIRNATIVRVRDGYLIKMPRALPLN